MLISCILIANFIFSLIAAHLLILRLYVFGALIYGLYTSFDVHKFVLMVRVGAFVCTYAYSM